MNLLHRWTCRSRPWRWIVGHWLLPWALKEVNLGDHVLELGPGTRRHYRPAQTTYRSPYGRRDRPSVGGVAARAYEGQQRRSGSGGRYGDAFPGWFVLRSLILHDAASCTFGDPSEPLARGGVARLASGGRVCGDGQHVEPAHAVGPPWGHDGSGQSGYLRPKAGGGQVSRSRGGEGSRGVPVSGGPLAGRTSANHGGDAMIEVVILDLDGTRGHGTINVLPSKVMEHRVGPDRACLGCYSMSRSRTLRTLAAQLPRST